MTNHYPPKFWRTLAEEALGVASELEDPECKRVMAGIAAAYEQLARFADLRQSIDSMISTAHDQEPPPAHSPS